MIIFSTDAVLPQNFLLEGLLLPVDKPYGWTSTDVVRKVQYLMRKYTGNKNAKVGHAGTLDPLATGVLLICVGSATKQAQALLEDDKEYIATIRFGATTASFDLEKPIDARFPFAHIDATVVQEALLGLSGTQMQVPPIFSAKMIGGVRSYDLARKGKEVELVANPICISVADMLSFVPGYAYAPDQIPKKTALPLQFPMLELPDELPTAIIRIRCSKGTYIRSFARDLGLALGSGAHLTDLRRTQSGQYTDAKLVEIKDIEQFFV